MNLVVKSLLIAVLLLGGAHAAGGDAGAATAPQAGKNLRKVSAAKPAPPAGKKTRPARGVKAKPAAQPDAEKARPAEQGSQADTAGGPSGADDQAVELGGVRG